MSEIVPQRHQLFCLRLPDQQPPEQSLLEQSCPPVLRPPAVNPIALTLWTMAWETVVWTPSAGNGAKVILEDLAAA